MVHGATFPTSGLGMPQTQGYASQRPQALMLTAGSGGYPASQQLSQYSGFQPQFSQYNGTPPQLSQFNSYPPLSQVSMPPIGQGFGTQGSLPLVLVLLVHLLPYLVDLGILTQGQQLMLPVM